ncbi:MAG: hypothetical protein KDA61_18990 [Planctomycetales bacterium]|nr:hypothetical protein [Planctomycetales bacterium]
MPLTAIRTFGSSELGDDSPRATGAAVDARGRLLVADNRRVFAYDASGACVAQNEYAEAIWSVATTATNRWYGVRGGVLEADIDGRIVAEMRDRQQLGRVTAVIALDDVLIVSDATHRVLAAYSRDGRRLRDIGRDVNTRGFMIPNGTLDAAHDPTDDTICVAHSQKHRVERYRADGAYLGAWGRFGMADPADFGGCCNPTNIAVSPSGLIAVSEKAPSQTKIYTRDGQFLAATAPGEFADESKNIALAFADDEALYAVEPQTRRIHLFSLVALEVHAS